MHLVNLRFIQKAQQALFYFEPNALGLIKDEIILKCDAKFNTQVGDDDNGTIINK